MLYGKRNVNLKAKVKKVCFAANNYQVCDSIRLKFFCANKFSRRYE